MGGFTAGYRLAPPLPAGEEAGTTFGPVFLPDPLTDTPLARSPFKTYGPNSGKKRILKMGMGSGKAILKARNPKTAAQAKKK